MSRLGKQVATGAPIVTVDGVLERIAAVDLDAVRDVARRVLEQPRDLAVVGPFAAEERERFESVLS
jgi:predicted Zn-dependent peptidase